MIATNIEGVKHVDILGVEKSHYSKVNPFHNID